MTDIRVEEVIADQRWPFGELSLPIAIVPLWQLGLVIEGYRGDLPVKAILAGYYMADYIVGGGRSQSDSSD